MALNFNTPADAEEWAAPCLRDWFGGHSETVDTCGPGTFWQWAARNPSGPIPGDVRAASFVLSIRCDIAKDGVVYIATASVESGNAECSARFARAEMTDALSAALGVMAEFLRLNTLGQENVRAPHAPRPDELAKARRDALNDAAEYVTEVVVHWREVGQQGNQSDRRGHMLASRIQQLAEPPR